MSESSSGPGPIVVTVFNQKGGVGKTTTSVNLAIALAAFDCRVTLIDLDSQGNATTSLGVMPPPFKGAYDLIVGAADPRQSLVGTRFANVTLFGATDELARVGSELAHRPDPELSLRRRLEQADLDVDFIVIDCPPAWGTIPINALAAADYAVMPVSPEPMAHDGLQKAWGNIMRVREHNPRLAVHGMLLVLTDEADDLRRGHAEGIRLEFGGRVYDHEIPRDHKVVEAAGRDIPLVVYDPDSPAAEAYLSFATEFLSRDTILRQHRVPRRGEADGGSGETLSLLHATPAQVRQRLLDWRDKWEADFPDKFAPGAGGERRVSEVDVAAAAMADQSGDGAAIGPRCLLLGLILLLIGFAAGLGAMRVPALAAFFGG